MNSLNSIRRLACCSLLTSLVMVGCGGGAPSKDLPNTKPVSGVVTLNGQPLSGATVVYIPSGSTAGIECTGMTDAEGKYSLAQVRGGKGAPPGTYSVAISSYVGRDGKPLELGPGVSPADAGAIEALPPRYSSATETKLTAVVPEEGGEVNFALKK